MRCSILWHLLSVPFNLEILASGLAALLKIMLELHTGSMSKQQYARRKVHSSHCLPLINPHIYPSAFFHTL